MEEQDGGPRKLLTGTTFEIQWQGISTLLAGTNMYQCLTGSYKYSILNM